MYQGIDTAARLTAAQAAKTRAQGLSFVGRYLIPESYGNALTAKEAAALRDAGLAILLCWELDAQAMKRGAAQGAKDGARARKLAEGMSIPHGTVIYFAADYDVPSVDLIQCEQYILAAQAALGKYQVGAYGGLRLVEFLNDRGTRCKLWQCVAWSGRFLDEADAIQYAWQGASDAKEMAAKLGFAVDLDSCKDMRRAGFWMPENMYEDGDSVIIEPNPWYADTVNWAMKEGIVTDPRPNDIATRAEVMQMIRNYNRRFEGRGQQSQ